MKIAQRVLLVIALVFLCVNTVRLTYEKWLESRSSVLDVYDEPVDATIREATTLEELLERYDAAYRAVIEYEADEAYVEIDRYERIDTEPYKSEHKLRAAIEDWERKSKEIAKIRVYWLFGLVFAFVGLAVNKWGSPWIATAALIVAFSEMIYWSSPSYFSGTSWEYDRMVSNKLVLAWISLALLLAAAYFVGALDRDESNQP